MLRDWGCGNVLGVSGDAMFDRDVALWLSKVQTAQVSWSVGWRNLSTVTSLQPLTGMRFVFSPLCDELNLPTSPQTFRLQSLSTLWGASEPLWVWSRPCSFCTDWWETTYIDIEKKSEVDKYLKEKKLSCKSSSCDTEENTFLQKKKKNNSLLNPGAFIQWFKLISKKLKRRKINK